MKAISGKNICKLLENKDWILKRVNGSHHIYAKHWGKRPRNQRGQYHLILYNNIFRIKSNTHAQTSNKGIILGGDRKPAQFKQQAEIK